MYHFGDESAGEVLAVLVLGLYWYFEEGKSLAEGEGEARLDVRGVVRVSESGARELIRIVALELGRGVALSVHVGSHC